MKRRQERWARRFVRLNSFQDGLLAESVNVLGRRDVRMGLHAEFGVVWEGVTRLFDEGEILSEPRGMGSLQKVEDDDDE